MRKRYSRSYTVLSFLTMFSYRELPFGWSYFLERRFCCAKSVACGRVIEREWGNPQRFPPHTPPSLRYARVRTTKPEGNHKKKHHPSGWCFLFGMPRAGLNSLPRPARSASNSEVRQGSCEWLCHSRDAGKRVRASSSTAPAPCFCPVIPSQ